MNITNYYKLNCQQPKLDFVDIKLNTDNLLFVDPRLIENLNDPISKEMQVRIEVFWGELIKSVRLNDTEKIIYLLAGLSEPNETRLGYSFSKPHGNSVASKLKPKIINAIQRNKAVKSGVLSHFSDVELFIEDVGSDRISDITTKIVKSVLIDFTQRQCNLYNIPMELVLQKDIFDYINQKWVKQKVNLPLYFGKPIIFVPKNIVRFENAAGHNINCFYRYAVRHFVSRDKKMLVDISPTGKEGKLLIRDIQGAHPLTKGSLSNWSIKYGKLLVDYKTDHLNGRIKPLSDTEIMQIIYDSNFSIAS